MTAKDRYREFLNSDFWKQLSRTKKQHVKKCERCRSKEGLQCHHRFYRKDWFQTQLDDLEVLCGYCHEREHGIGVRHSQFFPYREDERFNASIHRCHHLQRMIHSGRPLRNRDRGFLKKVLGQFPAKPDDTAIEHQVFLVLWSEAFCALVTEGTDG